MSATRTILRQCSRRLDLLERKRASRQVLPPLTPYQQDPSLILQNAGYTPDPWQAEVLRSRAKEILLLCSRQKGKSLVAGACILREVLLRPDSLVLILGKRQDQAVELLQEKVCKLYDALGRPVPAVRRATKTLRLANGSRVIACPNNEAGVRSYSGVRLLVIDEASRVPDAMYLAVRPMLAVSKGSIMALSTPFGQRGWFYNEWEKGAGWDKVKVTADQCPRITPEFLAAERMRLGDRWFEQEFNCRFCDAVDQLFSEAVIRGAIDPDLVPLLM